MCARADDLPSAAWMPMRAVTRPGATCALMASRTCASSSSRLCGRLPEISDCRRLTAPGWQGHGNFRPPAVDPAQRDGDLETVPRAYTATVTRHGFHPAHYAKIPR